MKQLLLQTADKLLFVKQLYDYSSRATNAKIRTYYAETLGVSERSFSDKMISHRNFREQELDVVEKLYLTELGQTVIDNQMKIFVDKMSNADLRTKSGDAAFQNMDATAQEGINQLNEEMENGNLLISKAII
jgi:hypothetical protein